jgi:dTDP-4-dehydrorhamnose 3,5-epimerase
MIETLELPGLTPAGTALPSDKDNRLPRLAEAEPWFGF